MTEMIGYKNSFVDAPSYLKNKESFLEIVEHCDLPHYWPTTFARYVNDWVQGRSPDWLLLDITSSFFPEYLMGVQCLISVYGGVNL